MFKMQVSSSDLLVIRIKDHVDKNLALRVYADDFFNYIESLDYNTLVIDFDGVVSVSRSFAHQFLNLMKNCQKRITIVNQSNEIKLIFNAVRYPREKSVIS